MALSRAGVSSLLFGVLAACGPTFPTDGGTTPASGPPELQPVRILNTEATQVQGEVTTAAMRYVKGKVPKVASDDDWVVRSSTPDVDGLHHVRMAQFHAGVRVFGGDVVVHAETSKFQTLTGNVVTNLDGFDVVPAYDGDAMLVAAKRDYMNKVKDSAAAIEFAREATELVILPGQSGRQAVLAWHVRFFTELQGGVSPGLWS